MPKDYAAENAQQATNLLVKRAPHRSTSWYKYAMAAAASGKWDDASHAINKARTWYPTNGNYCLAQFAIDNRREDWLRLIRVIDVIMYETEDNSAYGRFSLPQEFIPQANELKEEANSANIKLEDGRTVHFELPPTLTPPTTAP